MNWQFLDTATGLLAGLLAGVAIAFIVVTLFPPLLSAGVLILGAFVLLMLLLAS